MSPRVSNDMCVCTPDRRPTRCCLQPGPVRALLDVRNGGGVSDRSADRSAHATSRHQTVAGFLRSDHLFDAPDGDAAMGADLRSRRRAQSLLDLSSAHGVSVWRRVLARNAPPCASDSDAASWRTDPRSAAAAPPARGLASAHQVGIWQRLGRLTGQPWPCLEPAERKRATMSLHREDHE